MLLPGGLSKQAPKTHLMSEEEWGDSVSKGLGCTNYMTPEPQPHPSLWTTSSKRTMKMKYSWNPLKVKSFLHACA
ncbi:Cyclin-dependent kinases regulatory subunit 2 [Lemmus lemmus]